MSDAGDVRGGSVVRNPPRRELRPTGVEPKTSWTGTLKRTWSEFREDDLTDWAAALTYYGLLSLFPALIAVVSLVGLFADPQTITETSRTSSRRSRRSSAADTFGADRLDHVEPGRRRRRADPRHRPRAVGASGYVGAFMRAANVVYESARGGRSGSCARCRCCVTLVWSC